MKSFVFPTGQRNNPLGFFAGPQNDARLTRVSDWYIFFGLVSPFKKQQRQPKS